MTVLGLIVSKTGLPLVESEIETLTSIILEFGGLIFAAYGRWQAKEPLSGMGSSSTSVLLVLLLAGATLQPGCETLSPAAKESLKGTIKVATQVGLIKLLQGTNEALPYLSALTAVVSQAFDASDDPTEIGQGLASAITTTVSDYATQQLLLELMAEELRAPPQDDGVTAGPPGQRAFNLALADGIASVHRPSF